MLSIQQSVIEFLCLCKMLTIIRLPIPELHFLPCLQCQCEMEDTSFTEWRSVQSKNTIPGKEKLPFMLLRQVLYHHLT